MKNERIKIYLTSSSCSLFPLCGLKLYEKGFSSDSLGFPNVIVVGRVAFRNCSFASCLFILLTLIPFTRRMRLPIGRQPKY